MAGVVITPEIEHDARLLAERTGQTPTEAVADALRMRLGESCPGRSNRRKSVEELLDLLESHRLTPVNTLSEDEMFGYDAFGIPLS